MSESRSTDLVQGSGLRAPGLRVQGFQGWLRIQTGTRGSGVRVGGLGAVCVSQCTDHLILSRILSLMPSQISGIGKKSLGAGAEGWRDWDEWR